MIELLSDPISTVLYLALNLYHEAQGEPLLGQKAVCISVLNRAENRHLPVKEVIYQPYQFSWTFDDRPDAPENFPIFIKCVLVAIGAMDNYANGERMHGINHYFNPYIVWPSWADEMEVVDEIGRHLFLKG